MAIIIPEIVLFNLTQGILNFIASDIETAPDPSKSYLARILEGVRDGKHDYLVEARNLFSRKQDNPRQVRTRLFFDAQEANIPTVHITMPSETSGEDSLGASESEHIYADPIEGTYSPQRERRFNSTFHVIISSDNHREVLIIYHVIKSMLVSALSEVDIAGLQNPKLGGQDIRITENLVPPNIFMRGISLECSYDVEVPRFFTSEIISQIIINPGTPIDPTPSTLGIQSQVTVTP